MKPYIHAENSARKYGGDYEDYLAIHDFMDSSKAHIADVRHRVILHSTFGIFIAERVFGTYIINSDNKKIQVRDICEDHVLEDLGTIPTVQDWLGGLKIEEWMISQSVKNSESPGRTETKPSTDDSWWSPWRSHTFPDVGTRGTID